VHVVAVHNLNEDKEALGDDLAAALKVTVHEALMRLRAPGDGPLVVGVFAGQDPAAGLAERLRAAGFKAVVLTAGEIEREAGAWMVKRFEFGPDGLRIETVNKDGLGVSYKEIELILRGTGIVLSTSTETEKTRSLSIGRAVLTGGMMISKTTRTEREVAEEQRQGFINVYMAKGPVLALYENVLSYDSLGPARKPSRAGNFAHLVSELRKRCPGGRYDERLLSRAGQAALLGPTLNPEQHLVVASALLAKVLLGRT
jgi:hypothetical protein